MGQSVDIETHLKVDDFPMVIDELDSFEGGSQVFVHSVRSLKMDARRVGNKRAVAFVAGDEKRETGLKPRLGRWMAATKDEGKGAFKVLVNVQDPAKSSGPLSSVEWGSAQKVTPVRKLAIEQRVEGTSWRGARSTERGHWARDRVWGVSRRWFQLIAATAKYDVGDLVPVVRIGDL